MDNDIINDLITKVGKDVSHCINRTLAISPEPRLPLGMAAVAAAVGATALLLQRAAGTAEEGPQPESVLLAALLGARLAIDPETGTSSAFADLECLRSAGRIPESALSHETKEGCSLSPEDSAAIEENLRSQGVPLGKGGTH